MKNYIFTILILVTFHTFSFAQDNASVSGKVTGENNVIPEGSLVRIADTNLVTFVSPAGDYEFKNLKSGTYTLVVNALGFEPAAATVTVSANSETALHFNLKATPGQLQEVVISSSRAKETLGHTPVSVTVLNAKEIETQASINPNLSNMLSWTIPGLGFANNTTSNVGQTLRGRNLLVLIDGIPQSTPLRAGSRDIRSIDPAVVERIEVIKGSTSIYGNGADGGLINYITKRPVTGKKFGGTTNLGSTGNLVGIKNSIGGRFSQQLYGQVNKFDYVVSGLYDQTGVFKDAAGEVISPYYGLGETKSYNGFAKLGYNFTPDNRLQVMYNYFSSRQRSDYIAKPGKYGEYPTIGVKGDVLGQDQGTRYNHNASLTYTSGKIFGQTDLEASAYMQKFKTIFGHDSFFYGGGQSVIESDKKGLRASLITPFSFTGVTGSFTYGVDVLNDITSQPLADGRIWAPEMDMKNLAPYAQLNTTIIDDLVFKGGARYENITINVADYNTLATGPDGKGSVAVKGGQLNYNALTFNTGLRYVRYNVFKPYVSYSQGFSIFELGRILRSATENTIQQLNLDPVIVNNYEAGFNTDLRKLNFEAVYYISTSELGANLTEQNGVFVAQRAPERIHGFEIALTYSPLDWLQAGGSYAYVEGKTDTNKDGDAEDKEDKYLNSTRIAPPKATAFVKVMPATRFDVRLDYIHSGSRNRFEKGANGRYAFGEGKINGFDLVNLSTAYKVTDLIKLNLGIENLFNTRYYNPVAEFYGRDMEYTRGNGMRFNTSISIKF